MTPWTAACQASLSITNSRSLPKLMSIESVMPSNHLILCHPLLHLPTIFPSIRVFSFFFFSFFFLNFIFKLYIIVLVLPNIKMNPPQVYMCSPNESVLCIRWPKYWSFSFNIIPSNEHSGLISFRMDWLDLLAVQGTLKNLLQHHSSKASILWCSAS